MSDRPKTIPELRGMPAVPAERERRYSPESYAAQYGIAVDDARELIARSDSHPQIVRQILSRIAASPELKRRALMLDDASPLTEEEEQFALRALKGKSFGAKRMEDMA